MKWLAALALVLLMAVTLLNIVPIKGATDTVDISVNISETTIIEILPQSWSLVGVTIPNTYYNYSFMVENKGSTNITSIYADTTYPSSNPFGSGNATMYDAGNFLALKLNTSNTFYFANYVEYNDSQVWKFRWVKNWGCDPCDAKGMFRIAGNEYLWALKKGTNGDCANGTLWLSDTARTSETFGDVDLSTGGQTDIALQNASGDYGCADLGASAPAELQNYMVWVKPDCTQVVLVKYVPDTHAFADTESKCSNDVPLFQGTGVNALKPGEALEIDLRMTIPYGVRAGDLKTGTLTLTASGS